MLIEQFERALLGLLSPAGSRARLLILTYHRIPAQPDPLLTDEPDAATFAQHMDVLGTYCRVLPLPEAVRRLKDGTLPSRAACVTFDDGYENNLSVALPILEARGMTGTVFVAVNACERGIMWNDILVEAMRRAGGSAAGYEEFGMDRAADTNVPEPERIMRVMRYIRYEPMDQRLAKAEAFYRRVAGNALPRLMLTPEQVGEIARRGHDVGSHTVHHPILKTLSADAAAAEIAGSYDWVADVTGTPPRSFAYPNGWPGRDFDDTHAAVARNAGFELAVSMRQAAATSRSDTYQLPRLLPWGVGSRSFPYRLARTYVQAS